MDGPAFEIEIVRQGWLGERGPDYDPAALDLCTHGNLRVVVGGETIASGVDDGEYGISEAALGLLRTLESDRPHTLDGRFSERLIPHGCGTMLMYGCPIGITWSVTHIDGTVRIAEVVRYNTTSDSGADAARFPDLVVDVPEAEYRAQVIAFALEAKQPFTGVTKVIDDAWQQEHYRDFWTEYDELLARALS